MTASVRVCWAAALLAACAAGAPHAAYGQSGAHFFVVTELGNSYALDGPPTARPPGFDSSPYLNRHKLDTALSLTAGGGGTAPYAHFGEAGVLTRLPAFDGRRTHMEAAIILDWGGGADSRNLYAPVPLGELRSYAGQPYMAGARTVGGALDMLAYCGGTVNGTATVVACTDNRAGAALVVRDRTGEGLGHVADLPAAGKSIIHVDNRDVSTTGPFAVFFVCPECGHTARAFFGGDSGRADNRAGPRGFVPAGVPPPQADVRLWAANLTGLAWGSAGPDAGGNVYWKDGGPGCTPDLALSAGAVSDRSGCPGRIEGGAVHSPVWKPLAPGWNRVTLDANYNYIVVADPGDGARLQFAGGGPDGCCGGFRGELRNRSGSAVVVHDADRHLVFVPDGGSVPGSHPELAAMRKVQAAAAPAYGGAPRWLAHSERGDPVYAGPNYDENGAWPPYRVRAVDAAVLPFGVPDWGAFDVDGHRFGITVPAQEWHDMMLRTEVPGPLMDSEVYDVRNGVRLRTDEGTFRLWDGAHHTREYIRPFWHLTHNPVWERYGVALPEDGLLVVDLYATIPVVRPTRLSHTYVSSLPCGGPSAAEAGAAMSEVYRAANDGSYDGALLEHLVRTAARGGIADNPLLQHVYHASRTYLDYLDGGYEAGDSVHVPVLPNRPYLCTTIAPNILESQYHLDGLPHGGSYLSLGGGEAAVRADGESGGGVLASHAIATGVQSPRDGTVSLDVAARVGAAVSALGFAEHRDPRLAPERWANGTMEVFVEVEAAGKTAPLGSFTLDLYDVADESYGTHDGRCFGRFATAPDYSGYRLRTITADAALGEAIPVELRLRAVGPASDMIRTVQMCGGSMTEMLYVQFLVSTFAVDVR